MNEELQELIATFMDEPRPENIRRTDVEDCESEAFWMEMSWDESRNEHLQLVQSRSAYEYSKGTVHVVRQSSVNKQATQRQGRRCLLLTCFNFGCKGEH